MLNSKPLCRMAASRKRSFIFSQTIKLFAKISLWSVNFIFVVWNNSTNLLQIQFLLVLLFWFVLPNIVQKLFIILESPKVREMIRKQGSIKLTYVLLDVKFYTILCLTPTSATVGWVVVICSSKQNFLFGLATFWIPRFFPKRQLHPIIVIFFYNVLIIMYNLPWINFFCR